MLSTITHSYPSVPALRGDGSCAYRALLYGLCLGAVGSPPERERVAEVVRGSLGVLEGLGYDATAVEIFYDELLGLFGEVLVGKGEADVHAALTGDSAEYYTWYMRLLTSAHLKLNAGRFEPYLTGHADVASFCAAEVEPAGKECEQVQVIALAEALGVRVSVVYLDGHDEGGKFTEHVFGPEGAAIGISMLYRPGHYDLLFKD
jgi:ubiquitin thioesterase protein OTUB1